MPEVTRFYGTTIKIFFGDHPPPTEILIMKPPKIISAQVIGDRTLLIEFSQNEFKKYDVSNLLNKQMFAPLQNASFFKNFRIDSGGYGLVWNEDIDISEYELWKNGVSVKDKEGLPVSSVAKIF